MNKIKLIHKAKEILGQYASEYSQIQINRYVPFQVIGLAQIDWQAATNQIRDVFLGQWKNGMLSNLVYGKKNASSSYISDYWGTAKCQNAPDEVFVQGITQIPIYGYVLLKLYQLAENKEEALSFLREMYPRIHAFHNYLYTYRNLSEEGLISVIHPWESGTENSPLWDPVLDTMPEGADSRFELTERQHDSSRYEQLITLFQEHNFEEELIAANCPIRVQDPFFNAILSWSNEAMIEVGRIIQEDVTDFVLWNELTVYSMNNKLWDEEQGIYNAYDIVNNVFIPGDTLSGLLPIIADIPNIDQAENILRNIKDEFFSGTKDNPMYLCPSYDITSDNIRYGERQRGAISIIQNWLLYQGLKRFEMNAVAQKVKNDSLELIEKYGFCEFFNPVKKALIKSTKEINYYKNVSCAAICLDFLLEKN